MSGEPGNALAMALADNGYVDPDPNEQYGLIDVLPILAALRNRGYTIVSTDERLATALAMADYVSTATALLLHAEAVHGCEHTADARALIGLGARVLDPICLYCHEPMAEGDRDHSWVMDATVHPDCLVDAGEVS